MKNTVLQPLTVSVWHLPVTNADPLVASNGQRERSNISSGKNIWYVGPHELLEQMNKGYSKNLNIRRVKYIRAAVPSSHQGTQLGLYFFLVFASVCHHSGLQIIQSRADWLRGLSWHNIGIQAWQMMWYASDLELFLSFSILFSSHHSGTHSSCFHLSRDLFPELCQLF